ncbi:MAG: AhpC/TSA family protein [Phycisphaerales bacterium]|nr:AhpC/TSA family protein [Phycisphaerales bacterium]
MNTRSAIIGTALIGVLTATGVVSANTEPETTESSTESTVRETPYQLGEKLPNITLPGLSRDGKDVEVSLDAMLADGPVIVTFFRGSWCPYCRGELRAIEARLEKIEALGASVLAISPEKPSETIKLEEKLDIGFTLATDADNQIARQLGLLFVMSEEMIEKYHQYNLDVPKSNGTKTWELPIPATYIVDTDHTIRYVFDDVDYSKRADYDKVLKVLKEIQGET